MVLNADAAMEKSYYLCNVPECAPGYVPEDRNFAINCKSSPIPSSLGFSVMRMPISPAGRRLGYIQSSGNCDSPLSASGTTQADSKDRTAGRKRAHALELGFDPPFADHLCDL